MAPWSRYCAGGGGDGGGACCGPTPRGWKGKEAQWEAPTLQVDDGPSDRLLVDDHFLKFYQQEVREIQESAGDQDHLPVAGTLYSYLAMRPFGDSSGLFQDKASPLLLVGLYFIMALQIIGPFCLLVHVFSTTPRAVIRLDKIDHQISEHGSVILLGTKLMGLLFVVLFLLNGVYVMESDEKETKKIVEMLQIFKRAAAQSHYDPPAEHWLWIGAAINVWCLGACCLCMWPIMANSESPQDVLFDALSLTFLYNMDDITGDFGFIDDKWDEEAIGHIYGRLADHSHIMTYFKQYRIEHFTPDNVCMWGKRLGYAMLAVLPFLFLFVELEVGPASGGDGGGSAGAATSRRLGDEMAELRASNELLRAQLAALNATVVQLLHK